MKNQSNKIVMLEWLLPLLDQKLSQVSDGWSHESASDDTFAQVNYQQIAHVLAIACLPRLGHLANKINQLLQVNEIKPLTKSQKRLAHFAHQLLKNELIRYVQTGSYRRILIDSTTAELVRKLSLINQHTADYDSKSTQIDIFDEQQIKSDNGYCAVNELMDNIDAILPKHPTDTVLQSQQLHQLLVAWRQQLYQLLVVNTNQLSILQPLITVSDYLWQAKSTKLALSNTRLWYFTKLWLTSLGHNAEPLPSDYIEILSRLEQVLEANTHKVDAHQNDDTLILSDDNIESLISDIYIQLASLLHTDSDTQRVLDKLSQPADITLRFLPRILIDLETVIFRLENPQSVVDLLQLIKIQFAQRGWSLYANQVNQIIVDITSSLSAESKFTEIQARIELQLQELYSAVYDTEHAIHSYTDTSISIDSNSSSNTVGDARQAQALNNVTSNATGYDDSLEQVSQALVVIKNNFADYIYDQSSCLMSSTEAFAKVSKVLSGMSLNSVRKISEELEDLLAQIEDYRIINLGSKLTHALIAIIATFEHLLDCLAQQVLNEPLIQQGYSHIEQAQLLLAVRLANPEAKVDNFIVDKVVTEVLRYDDSGEVAATAQTLLSESAKHNSADSHRTTEDKEASQLIPAQIQSGDLQVDEAVGNIFIVQVTEIIADLIDFLPIWQQDPQDLTALMEVKRNFQALRESAPIAGAFEISTLAEAHDQLLSKVLDNTLPINEDLVSLMMQALTQLPILLADFTTSQTPNADLKALTSQSDLVVTVTRSEKTNAPVTELDVPAALMSFIQKSEPLPNDSDDADPVIKEIFVEEAEEVLAEIMPLYQQWCADSNDLAKLTEVRRGFHTLKGSGRMVGANFSAALAWSIENMLNRILERSIEVSTDIKQLITDVLVAYPQLVETFADGRDDYPATVSIWIACANAYSDQQAADFSYSEWRNQQSSEYLQDDTDQDVETAYIDKNADVTLQTIHSVNEIMAEATVVVVPQSEDEQAFYEIFAEEANSLLQEITNFVQIHLHQDRVEVSDEIVRAFHTLRAASGSSALVAISEISATIEHSLEQLQHHDIAMTPQHLQALTQSVSLIEGYLNTYDRNIKQQNITVESQQSHQDVASLQAMLDESDEIPAASDNQLSVAQLLNVGIDALLDAEWQLVATLNAGGQSAHIYIDQLRHQIAKLSLSTSESSKFTVLLAALEHTYNYLDKHLELTVQSDIQDILLSGHAQLVGLFDALAGSMSLKVDQDVIENLQAIEHQSTQSVSMNIDESSNVYTTLAHELHTEIIDTDIELLEIFLQEAHELNSAAIQTFDEWRNDIFNKDLIRQLQRYTHIVRGGAQMSGVLSIAQLADESATLYESLAEGRIDPDSQWLEVMQNVQDTLTLQLNHITDSHQSFFATELIEQCQSFNLAGKLPKQVNLILPASQSQHFAESPTDTESESSTLYNAQNATNINQLITNSWPNGMPDADILEVYLEEADELINSSSKYLQLFLDDNNNIEALQSLQRDLHTIKGGARMVAANGIADLAHEMESIYEELALQRRPATNMILELLNACHDWFVDAIFVLKQQVNPLTPTALIEALQQFSINPTSLEHIPNQSLQDQRATILAAKTKQNTQRIVKDIRQMPSMTGNFVESIDSVSSSEMIRISGSLIEHMINLSGESAINRARIDMGMTSLTTSIEDMGITVQRLADQLRRMDGELEVQILAQIDEALIEKEDFDPLEMDQYSSLNQLSKSLSESASDLVDINNTLLEKTRDSEGLLLQLSRTQTELQDGLMKSRIVPFTRLIPRLERVVRQTANELNKSVDLTIINADDEMDRTILERITSPLEHMLRNAVDHGIEETQERIKAGKERNGHIILEVLREGSEVVINLSDDGRGINVEAVRKKAIAKGLIDSNNDTLSDLDVMQYIFNAGLTTTEQLTQISGRGVGMDVVISEIRQLGGVVSVSSSPNQGSKFTIRVPLSVAVTDALVVRMADRYYAIPLVQIERVMRVNPEKLYDYYQSKAATLVIDDTDYRVRYLNEILSGSPFNDLMVTSNTSVPLIVLKSRTGQNIALQVDQIAGSRIEIVVKPLGRQLSHINGISAATIMGDGSVMLILDLVALMRNVQSIKEVKLPNDKVYDFDTEKPPTILVVDDSVTVRKVTSRFLERQGINVIIAKDGVDAMEVLQETIPDLILLDIEMPRMDGFEVATQVRYNKLLKNIPIIMITSRTGEKHRERALDIGVNDYMGKPFQEKQLLQKIKALLGSRVSLDYDG